MTAQRQYIALGGGLDTESAVLSVPPGFVREAWNFEQAVDGGYSRVLGYERFDGHPSPSQATYVDLEATLTVIPEVGDVVTGETSPASGRFLSFEDGMVRLADTVGTFDIGENLLVGTDVVGVVNGFAYIGTDAATVAQAENLRRLAISEVPGSGPVRGIAYFAGALYAFRNTTDGTAKKMYRSTAAGWVEVTTPALLPFGKLESVVYDFGDGDKLFGCDGINKAFQFDGTTYTEITTGATSDNPRHIAAHQNHLFVAMGSSLMHSGVGDPLDWDALSGAGEINVGAPITNMVPQPGSQGAGALAVSTPSSLHILYGTSAADWSFVVLQSEVGAKEWSMQNIGVAFMLSEMGVTIIGQSQEYGNFAHSVVSSRAKSWLKRFGQNITCSTIHHEKNQYRLFFGNRGLFITVRGREVVGMMPVEYHVPVECCLTTSDDKFFFGGQDGFVYQGGSGRSFDGRPIYSLLVFPFNSSKSIRQRKRYRRLIAEISAESPVEMQANFTLSYGDMDALNHETVLNQRGFSTSEWDVATWDVDFWDGGTSPVARIELAGVGENISVALSHESAVDMPFVLRSFILEFSPRRGER
jgi:hypothetical protein